MQKVSGSRRRACVRRGIVLRGFTTGAQSSTVVAGGGSTFVVTTRRQQEVLGAALLGGIKVVELRHMVIVTEICTC